MAKLVSDNSKNLKTQKPIIYQIICDREKGRCQMSTRQLCDV